MKLYTFCIHIFRKIIDLFYYSQLYWRNTGILFRQELWTTILGIDFGFYFSKHNSITR